MGVHLLLPVRYVICARDGSSVDCGAACGAAFANAANARDEARRARALETGRMMHLQRYPFARFHAAL
jgi:hypothetical protein